MFDFRVDQQVRGRSNLRSSGTACSHRTNGFTASYYGQTDTSFDFTRRKADTSSTQLTSTFMEDNKRHLRGHKFVHGMDANEERMWWWSKKEIPVDEWVKSFLPPEHDKDFIEEDGEML
ncbi:unnamed protein product [Peronospora belbahrii]|uniref:Uncharacterized protein n=1 Tax=Peronospora belbahrii TaxID=622444 RepID=A0AAU9KR74_9STRA|nr:unnamed protein product [Peronospora belbahrii]